MTASTASQRAWILTQLQQGKRLTPMDALDKVGCFRLGARIHELRKDGWNIDTALNDEEGEPRYAIYTLRQEEAA